DGMYARFNFAWPEQARAACESFMELSTRAPSSVNFASASRRASASLRLWSTLPISSASFVWGACGARSLHIPAARRDPGGQGCHRGRCAYRPRRNRQNGQNRHHHSRGARWARRGQGGERMGPRVMHRPPKFVQGFLDRHGKPRWYFRRPGFKRVPLPGLPWSVEFMTAYEEALAGQLEQVGCSRVRPGTFRALAVSYYNSLGFRSLKPSSQTIYRRIIDRFCREHGDKRAATLQRQHVVKL